MTERTIRLTPVGDPTNPDEAWEWRVDPSDPANGNAEMYLDELGYGPTILPDHFGHLVRKMAFRGIAVIFGPLPEGTRRRIPVARLDPAKVDAFFNTESI